MSEIDYKLKISHRSIVSVLHSKREPPVELQKEKEPAKTLWTTAN